MPVIVSNIKSIESAVSLRDLAGPSIVSFESGDVASIIPGSDVFVRKLDCMKLFQRCQRPLWVNLRETESVGPAIVDDVLFPITGGVSRIWQDDSGSLRFVLDRWSKPYTLPRAHPAFDLFSAIVNGASGSATHLAVTEADDGRTLVDVRFREPQLFPAVAAPASAPPTPVDSATAEQLFEIAAARTCPGADCIPFRYPQNGCNSRAHEMCRIIIAGGVQPGKIWSFPQMGQLLETPTPNDPDCKVEWAYHVAVTLNVQDPGATGFTAVIDPSLFDGPVTVDEWTGVQGGAGIHVFTGPEIFLSPLLHAQPEFDPQFIETSCDLTYFRCLLKQETDHFGPPPYPKCS